MDNAVDLDLIDARKEFRLKILEICSDTRLASLRLQYRQLQMHRRIYRNRQWADNVTDCGQHAADTSIVAIMRGYRKSLYGTTKKN